MGKALFPEDTKASCNFLNMHFHQFLRTGSSGDRNTNEAQLTSW